MWSWVQLRIQLVIINLCAWIEMMMMVPLSVIALLLKEGILVSLYLSCTILIIIIGEGQNVKEL